MHRILSIILLSVSFTFPILAQQLPLFTQYVFDPYLINPSMVGIGNRPEVNVLYRRQYTAIQDGPKTMQFDAQLPFSNRMAIGVNVYNDKSVLLSSTSALLTYGYKIPLATNQTLGFGLSAGVFTNRINLSEVAPADANDPALLSAASNNMALNGQFGVHYSFKSFILGFSLVNLIQRTTFTPDNFQKIKFGELKNQIFFASYRFTLVPDTWFFQPNVAYRQNADNVNFYETSGFLSYRSKIDLGGGYRQNFGPSAMLRITWKQLSIGAAYDFPSTKSQVSTGGTQEFQLKWRFGARNEPPVVKKNTIPTPKEEEKIQPVPEEKKEVVKEEPKEEIVPQDVIVEKKTEVVQQPAEPVVPQPPPVEEDFYFVIGTFELRRNAKQFYDAVRKKGIVAEIRESKSGQEPHYFYVHMPQYKSREVTLDKILELKKNTGFQDAWFKKL
jgi:type IX secretion system PorP/SprF family membrane protein